MLSKTCTITLPDLSQLDIRFVVEFVIAPARVWDFQDAGREEQVAVTLARVIATSLKRWASSCERSLHVAVAIAAYDEATGIIATTANEAASRVGIAIGDVTVTSIEPVR